MQAAIKITDIMIFDRGGSVEIDESEQMLKLMEKWLSLGHEVYGAIRRPRVQRELRCRKSMQEPYPRNVKTPGVAHTQRSY